MMRSVSHFASISSVTGMGRCLFQWVWIGGILGVQNTTAQSPPPGVGGGVAPQEATIEKEEIDTSSIYYHFAQQPYAFRAYEDTLLARNFHQFDPARQHRFDYYHLGNVGTALLPVVYQPRLRFGLDLGQHSFDAYRLENQDIPFYRLQTAFTDVQYDFQNQVNSNLKTRFSRNFAGGIHLSLLYQRTTNLNDGFKSLSDSFYQPPPARTSSFGIGFWYRDKRGKYDGFFTFVNNIVIQRNTGGMVDVPSLRVVTSVPNLIPVFLDDTTYHTSKEYAYRHYYRLNKNDSNQLGGKRQYLLSHQIRYQQWVYKFHDFNSNQRIDSLFFGSFLTDARGLRYYLSSNLLENGFSVSTAQWRKTSDTLTAQNPAIQKDGFELGLVHQYRTIQEEPLAYTNQNVLLTGRWHFAPNDFLKIESYAHFNALGANLGDYRIAGNLYLNLPKWGSFKATFLNQLSEPSLLEQRLFVSQHSLWDNRFKKILETQVTGSIQIPSWKLEAMLSYILLNNYTYFDSLAYAQQVSSPMSILQLLVKQDFTIKKIHLDNEIALQKSTDKIIRLPDIYAKHSLYYEGKVFKKVMLLRTGFDLRYNNTYQGYGYMPLTGQFYLQNNPEKAFFPFIDVFLSAKVQRFRVFIKYENMARTLRLTQNRGYLTARYPIAEQQFRLGIRWELRN